MFDDRWVRKQVYSLAEARQFLFDYFWPKVVVYGRTPVEGASFDENWDHISHVLVQKAIKDTMIKFIQANDGVEEISLS